MPFKAHIAKFLESSLWREMVGSEPNLIQVSGCPSSEVTRCAVGPRLVQGKVNLHFCFAVFHDKEDTPVVEDDHYN